MPLTFNVSKIKDYNQNFPSVKRNDFGKEYDAWHPVTEVLVKVMMILGFCDITEANLEESWTRLNLYQHHIHPLLQDFDGKTSLPRYITRQEFEQHLGLSTNCSTTTKAQFNKKFMEILCREHQENSNG